MNMASEKHYKCLTNSSKIIKYQRVHENLQRADYDLKCPDADKICPDTYNFKGPILLRIPGIRR